MKICCKDFKELIRSLSDYPSLIFVLNINSENNITFDLAFTNKTEYGQSWRYLKYCPFCATKLKEE